MGDFAVGEFGGKANSMDKSVGRWAQKNLRYHCGKGLRDKTAANDDKGILKPGGKIGTKANAMF